MKLQQLAIKGWTRIGPRFLPFADAASAELPLPRLLRLSLFQVSVGMAMALLNGTLNRVMIVELSVPAWLVSLMIALPIVFAPLRALVGHKSDHHLSALGWKRVPYIWFGSLMQFGALAIIPFSMLVLTGKGEGPAWVGHAGAALGFLLLGAGLHTTQTAGLALATDLAPAETRPRVVALLYVSLLLGMVGSSLMFSWLLRDFNATRLVQVVQGAAVLTMLLNAIALWKQEPRRPRRAASAEPAAEPFRTAWRAFIRLPRARRMMWAVGLGSAAFSMQDVLLEPYGGQILHMSVGDTTLLTATLAAGGLFGFGLASSILSRGFDPFRMAVAGALVGMPAFMAVMLAASFDSVLVFGLGVALIGFGGGLFGHGTLTATMNRAPKDQVGLALGAWGAVQATAAGVAVALGGILRDGVSTLAAQGAFGLALAGPTTGYAFVYGLEVLLLATTVLVMTALVAGKTPRQVAA
jgi:BCD family chlorophyll transporter-like MFS transporter